MRASGKRTSALCREMETHSAMIPVYDYDSVYKKLSAPLWVKGHMKSFVSNSESLRRKCSVREFFLMWSPLAYPLADQSKPLNYTDLKHPEAALSRSPSVDSTLKSGPLLQALHRPPRPPCPVESTFWNSRSNLSLKSCQPKCGLLGSQSSWQVGSEKKRVPTGLHSQALRASEDDALAYWACAMC